LPSQRPKMFFHGFRLQKDSVFLSDIKFPFLSQNALCRPLLPRTPERDHLFPRRAILTEGLYSKLPCVFPILLFPVFFQMNAFVLFPPVFSRRRFLFLIKMGTTVRARGPGTPPVPPLPLSRPFSFFREGFISSLLAATHFFPTRPQHVTPLLLRLTSSPSRTDLGTSLLY